MPFGYCALRELQPFADDRFRLPARMARHPGRIDIGSVDAVEAVRNEGIDQIERSAFIRSPAKDVAAED